MSRNAPEVHVGSYRTGWNAAEEDHGVCGGAVGVAIAWFIAGGIVALLVGLIISFL